MSTKPKSPKVPDIDMTAGPLSLDAVLKINSVDPAIWEVEKYNIKTRADKGNVPQYGHEVYLRKKTIITVEDWFKDILKDVSQYRKATPVAKIDDSNLLYEINIPDLHLSKMAWSPETGYRDYDTKIACHDYNAAVDDFIYRLGPLKPRILLPVGNDFFNADTPEDETTGGTKQDVDTRWKKSFRAGCALLSGVIEKLSKTYKVDVIVVVGNHDATRMWYLGEYLIAWFKGNPNVTIENEPKPRKYYEFGKNFFMFTHGDKEKQDNLPLLMATEKPVEWGRTKHRFVRVGHYHHEILKEYLGTKVHVIPSLTPPDEWHANQGYVGNTESAIAFLYDFEKGLLTQHHHNV